MRALEPEIRRELLNLYERELPSKVNPSGRLDVDASGGSHVTYVGNPTLGDIDTSGGSSVEHE